MRVIVGSEILKTDEAQSPVFDPGIALIYQLPTASTPVLEAGLNCRITSKEALPTIGLWLWLTVLLSLRNCVKCTHTNRRISSPATSGIRLRSGNISRKANPLIRGSQPSNRWMSFPRSDPLRTFKRRTIVETKEGSSAQNSTRGWKRFLGTTW